MAVVVKEELQQEEKNITEEREREREQWVRIFDNNLPSTSQGTVKCKLTVNTVHQVESVYPSRHRSRKMRKAGDDSESGTTKEEHVKTLHIHSHTHELRNEINLCHKFSSIIELSTEERSLHKVTRVTLREEERDWWQADGWTSLPN